MIDLPVEMILSIADFLPAGDILCLSLCNHQLFAILRSLWKPRLELGEKDWLSLLSKLERDHPQYFFCHFCLILHRFDRSKIVGLSAPSFQRSYLRLPCFGAQKPTPVFLIRFHNKHDYTLYRFSFLHLQLAMKQFYHGPEYGISTKALEFTEIRNRKLDHVAPFTTLFSIDAQICPQPPGLCLRSQDIISIDYQHANWLALGGSLANPPAMYRACVHNLHLSGPVELLLVSYRARGPMIPISKTCTRCNTEYQLELRENGDEVALVITKWINLGPGISPDDPRWKVQTLSYESASIDRLYSINNPEYIALSPRSVFASLNETSLGALSSRNLSYLKDRRYETVMQTTFSNHVWVNSPQFALLSHAD
jgi:hypothetical protein